VNPRQYDQLSPKDAVQLQRDLASQLRLQPLTAPVKTIGGADISYNKFSDLIYAAIVVLSFPELQIIETAGVRTIGKFPYIPGLLGFRELPSLMEVWDQLKTKPDVLVMDGHGTAHPRKMGVATHFGIVENWPSIGCGKTRLTGTFEPVPEKAGSSSDLIARDGSKIGEVLRTRDRVNPVFVSPGNLITQEEATNLMLRCVTKYRIPEPTRQAHLYVNQLRLADGAAPQQSELF
jgi:deoxyribonuclease V